MVNWKNIPNFAAAKAALGVFYATPALPTYCKLLAKTAFAAANADCGLSRLSEGGVSQKGIHGGLRRAKIKSNLLINN